jgi:short-subunit dehydrogenase
MPLLDVNIGVAKKMFDVNVFGLIAVTQAFSSLLIAAKGKIINIGSVVGRFPAPYMGTSFFFFFFL